MTRRKKLIEVALPLEAINVQAAREKSIRHGHPSTLHLWWARRPLAACRAVLFAQLVDDPESDPAYRRGDGSVDLETTAEKRAQLFDLIEELVKWENSGKPSIINAARAEIARCVVSRLIEEGKLQKDTIVYGKDEGKPHPRGANSGEYRTAWELIVHGHGDLDRLARREIRLCPPEVVDHVLATYAPPVLDPFAGGGSIPLEAQRLGLRAHASDLNPVAVLINKALIEIPPRFAGLPPVNPEDRRAESDGGKLMDRQWRGAQGLAADVRYYGQWMRDEAAKRIGHLYPKVKVTVEMAKGRPDLADYVGRELTVIAWLWARTVRCSNPACVRRMPMVRSFWLSNKKGAKVWADPILDHNNGTVHFEIRHKGTPPEETTNRTMARCLFCGAILKKAELRKTATDHGMAEIPLAIVAEGDRCRVYLEACLADIPDVEKPKAPEIDQPITDDKRWFSPPQYGLPTFRDLFTPRQLTALTTFSDLVGQAREKVLADATAAGTLPDESTPLTQSGTGPQAYADAVAIYLAFGVDKCCDYWCSIATWAASGGFIRGTFARQALPMTWDFCECNPFSDATANWSAAVEWIALAVGELPASSLGQAKQLNARVSINGMSPPVISTDPPYYDNIGYADLSDFFYIWLRRTLRNVEEPLLSTMLTPKVEEMIASPYRHGGDKSKAAAFFEEGLGCAIGQWREKAHADYSTAIYYAFKQAETNTEGTASTGWETFLDGVITNGFTITGTWPMRTERGGRTIGVGANALASSVVLACVPRETDAPMATRREFINALKDELPEALRKLQSGNIAPVDLAQAAIGPGMAVFSRYGKVLESDGSAMSVRTALTLINQTLDEVLAEQEGEFDSDTRWAVAWFAQHGTAEGPYGTAETLSKAKNTSVQGLAEAGVVAARSGKVALVDRDAMPADWDPAADDRFTIWEATQHLIRRLQNEGEQSAAQLLARLGGETGELARDLAYRLYTICERKGWAQEALAYNSLVIAWSEIGKLSRAASRPGRMETGELI